MALLSHCGGCQSFASGGGMRAEPDAMLESDSADNSLSGFEACIHSAAAACCYKFR